MEKSPISKLLESLILNNHNSKIIEFFVIIKITCKNLIKVIFIIILFQK